MTATSEQPPSRREALAAVAVGALAATLLSGILDIFPSSKLNDADKGIALLLYGMIWTIGFALIGGPLWLVFHRRGFRRSAHAIGVALIIGALATLIIETNLLGVMAADDPDRIVNLLGDANGPYRVHGALTVRGWWTLFEALLMIPVCAAVGVVVTWFLAYRIPSPAQVERSVRLSLRRATAALVVGSIAASLVYFAVQSFPGEFRSGYTLFTVAALALLWTIAAAILAGPLWLLAHRRGFSRPAPFVVAAFLFSFLLTIAVTTSLFGLGAPDDSRDLSNLFGRTRSAYRADGVISAHGWWLIFERTLLIPLCCAVGAAAAWFVAYRAPTLTITGRTRLKMLVAAILGIVISPLLGAGIAGLMTSQHWTADPDPRDGRAPASFDAEQLIAAYGAVEALPWRWEEIAPPGWKLTLSSCGYGDQYWGLYRGSYAVESGYRTQYAETRDDIVTDAVKLRTTAFGRGFWTACLRSSLYHDLCRPFVKPIFDAAFRDSRSKLDEHGLRISQAVHEVQCRYVDGVRAREMHAPYLPSSDK